jgi:xanthine dehydrogenase YagR molybdenum-binding subunit
VEGPDKVTGRARYAAEYSVADLAYAYPVQSSVASGTITGIDTIDALAIPGVITVFGAADPGTYGNTDNFELTPFRDSRVTYRGQLVALVVAESLETAREAAGAVWVGYEPATHDVSLRADHPGLYRPEKVNPAMPTDTGYGDVTAGLEAAAARVSVTYTTPVQHNNPMEPHAEVGRGWLVG